MSDIYKTFKENELIVRRIVAKYRPLKEDVEDLMQETFIKCFAASIKQEILDPKAFILKVAKNVAISEAKRKRHSITKSIEDMEDLEVYENKQSVSLESQVDEQQKLAAFTKVLAELSIECQRVLIMRKIDGLKFKQIATRLDVSVSTVEKRVATALLQCNDKLRAQGYNLTELGQKPNMEKIKRTRSSERSSSLAFFSKYTNEKKKSG